MYGVAPIQYTPRNTTQTHRPSVISDSTGMRSISQHPSRRDLHLMFEATRFPADIDCNTFYEPALLATRLISSPQGLHYDYCLYFGKTVPGETPSGFSVEQGPNWLPYQYVCEKAIDELTEDDIEAVQKQRLLELWRIVLKSPLWPRRASSSILGSSVFAGTPTRSWPGKTGIHHHDFAKLVTMCQKSVARRVDWSREVSIGIPTTNFS